MVVVSHVHKFIFLKTRKTAGTSVEMYLEPFCAPPGHVVTEKTPLVTSAFGIVGERLKGGQADPDGGIDLRNHAAALDVKKTLGRTVWRSYARLTTVRNPFDRMVSAFHWRQHRDEAAQDQPFDQIKAQFRAFVLGRSMPNDSEIVHIKDRFIINDAVRFEHIRADLARLAAIFGFDPAATQLPVTKETTDRRQGRGFWDYYQDDETVNAVRKHLAWVFDHYDYPTTPQAPNLASAAQ